MNIYLPFVRQPSWYTCMPACGQMVLAREGIVLPLGFIKRGLQIRCRGKTANWGTTSENALRFFYQMGAVPRHVIGGTRKELLGLLKRGIPVLVRVNPRPHRKRFPLIHTIVITGFTKTHWRIADPAKTRPSRIRRRLFMRRWHQNSREMIYLDSATPFSEYERMESTKWSVIKQLLKNAPPDQ